eukprot:CAMPEP_0194104670 /NCGR_PEP_ID=MMETSP0150-20130528/5007_1 /TAXON_ID=122233 /ORGANISM="Chaetoceros debilis, Strain MM31A-1" /LENGTH=799 /DNA_ID=CAMNT_0038792299 /DNA_START=120 /DNA_END=2518 /DNA_ORIENTATION=+
MTLVAAVVLAVVLVVANQMPNADLMNLGKEINIVAVNVVGMRAARGHDRVIEIMIEVIVTLVAERLVLRMSSDEDLPKVDLKNFGIEMAMKLMTIIIEKMIEDVMRKGVIVTTEDEMKIMKKKINLVGDQINVVGMAVTVVAAVHAHAHVLPLPRRKRLEEFRKMNKLEDDERKKRSSKSRSQDRGGRGGQNPERNDRRDHDFNRDYDQRDRDRPHDNPQSRGRPRYDPRDDRRQLQEAKLQRGDIVKGKIARMETYGAFVAISAKKTNEHPGDIVDADGWKQITGRRPPSGLAHVSQISHTGRIDAPSDIVTLDQTVYAIVLEVWEERGRDKISVSISGVDQETWFQREPSVWNMPEPRHTMDLGDGAIGGGGGAAMFASYMAGSGGGGNQGRRGGGRNQQNFLPHRAKERKDMRMMEDGDNTWRGRTVERERTRPNANGSGAAIVLSLIWNRSPSPPAEKKRGKKAKGIAPRTKSKSRSRSRSSSVDSSSTASSSGSSSRSSYSSSSDSDSDSYSSVSRRSNRGKERRSKGGETSVRRKRRHSASSSGSSSGSSSSSDSSGSKRRDRKSRRKRSKSADDEHLGKKIKVQTSNDDDGAENNDKDDDDAKSDKEQSQPLNKTEAIASDDEELREAREFKKAVQGEANSDSDDDDDMGPMPLVNSDGAAGGGGDASQKAYGGALLPGEGEALAAYVQQNLRIPRRGEIGYDASEIDKHEKSGFVMSGSRHARMNAVRIRKENQVYSAEEQRALALITLEENQQKEAALMNDFRTMLKEKQDKLIGHNAGAGDTGATNQDT